MSHATTQQVAIRLTSLGAVLKRDSSTLQPDFRTLWKTSIFQRSAYLGLLFGAQTLTGNGSVSVRQVTFTGSGTTIHPAIF